MARKGLFGRLLDAGRDWIEKTFSSNRANESTSQQAMKSEAISNYSDDTESDESDYETFKRIERELEQQRAKEEASRRAAHEAEVVQSMKERLEPLIDEANRRSELLQSQGYASAALSRAEQETGRDYFTLDDATTRGEVIEEATRARVFLADETSTIEGAKIYTAQLNAAEFRGKFGNQYHTWEHKFKNFDTSAIDEEVAKTVFSNYRKLEELRAADITGDGAYGSENLIIAMYDAQIRGEDSFMAGLEQLDAHYRKKTKEWKSRFEHANEVGSILGTMLDYDEEGGLFF